jgi:cytochrome P450 family 26 subfamily A
MRAKTAEKWFQQRVQSKLSLFGKPTVFIYGQAENKFIFTSDSITLAKAKHKL